MRARFPDREGSVEREGVRIFYEVYGGGSRVPADQRTYTVTILDIYGDIACVRADSYHFVDYLHLARWEGGRLLMNALYARNLNQPVRPNAIVRKAEKHAVPVGTACLERCATRG